MLVYRAGCDPQTRGRLVTGPLHAERVTKATRRHIGGTAMSRGKVVYPYVPNSVPEIKAQMLKEVGARDPMDLYAEIPEHLRLHERMNLPEPILDEYSIRKHVEALLDRNRHCDEFLNFYVGESYADHGKWQALFEYASLMGELLEMDVLSCPLYDGLTAAATS